MAVLDTPREVFDERIRTVLPSTEDRKGLMLSHLLGFALFGELALNILDFNLPFTPANSIPIRLIAIWLFIDRTGRKGRLRIGTWDYMILGFVLATAIGMIFTSIVYPDVPSSFDDFRRFVGLFLNAYLYYLVAREGLNRRGFRPDIVINWVIGGFAWSALVGLMQTANLFHARVWSLRYASASLETMRDLSNGDVGSSFASGTAPWWNSMALEMIVAFGLVFSPVFVRKPKWYEWCLGMLFMGAFICTQSRGGLMAFGTCAVATVVWYAYHKRYALAFVIGTVVTVGVVIWVTAVFALHIKKFTDTLEGQSSDSEYSQSFDARLQQQRDLVSIGMRLPFFGTGPNFVYLSGHPGYWIWSDYAHNGASDTMYGFMFAEFGLVGIVFVVLMQGYLVGFIRKSTAYRPYAFAAFFVGVAFTVHGLAEFLLYSRTFMIMNLLAAFVGTPLLVSEKGLAPFRRVLKPATQRSVPAHSEV